MAEQLMKDLADGTATFELRSQKKERQDGSLFASKSFASLSNREEPDQCFARIGSLQRATPPFAKKLEHYAIQKVKGDGRCMFRALALGRAFNEGHRLSTNEEQNQADDLRMKVKDALCSCEKNRQKYEEALIAITIDESLKRYCERIRYPGFWGGESELLVLSRMYKQPIIVYIPEHETKRSGSLWGTGFIPIAEYGLEFLKATKEAAACKPIRLLFSGSNHYDLLV
eukprot:c20038_g1_i2 orf=187-870(+)